MLQKMFRVDGGDSAERKSMADVQHAGHAGKRLVVDVDPVGRYRALFLRLRRAPQILAGQIQLTVSSSSPESVEEGEEWWCSRPHRPFERAKMLVACIRAAPSSGSDPKAVSSSLQVTQATSPRTWIRTSEHATDQGRALAKIFSQDRRTSDQPSNRCHPGCTQLADSSCSHTRSIAERSRVSRAR